jgi:aminoglycoside/choline kinase family phosphotransferase
VASSRPVSVFRPVSVAAQTAWNLGFEIRYCYVNSFSVFLSKIISMSAELEKLKLFYHKSYGCDADSIKMITQAGSPRKYFRFIKNDNSILGVYSENVEETETFLYYSDVFTKANLNTPAVYNVSEDKYCYFIQDFGDDLLLGQLEKEPAETRYSGRIAELYKKSLAALVKLQVAGASMIDFGKAYQISDFDEQAILFDLNYFKYYFLNRSGVSFNEKLLQDDFDRLAKSLANEGPKLFMFRDFQARNIVVKDNEPYFIDYQGGRRGAPEYDAVSLLYQAKAALPEVFRDELRDFYFNELIQNIELKYAEFYDRFYLYVYLRVMQTLGAYGLRGLIENKQHFVESIPFALRNLSDLLKLHPFPEKYPELLRVLNLLAETSKFDSKVFDKFTVQVFSFSFKKGIPNDSTGNGGGFVFDCRGIHNPGRYAEYKTKTGKDQEVIDFFKANSDIDIFFENAVNVVKPTIENYIERGFNSLMISFGCTGGQHRSVYCAEALAKYIRENYTANVVLVHREQG